jgi:hypothetical protein
MININTAFGKAMLVFFWGGMAAHLTLIVYFATGERIPVVLLPITFMICNASAVFIKNFFDPKVKNF